MNGGQVNISSGFPREVWKHIARRSDAEAKVSCTRLIPRITRRSVGVHFRVARVELNIMDLFSGKITKLKKKKQETS